MGRYREIEDELKKLEEAEVQGDMGRYREIDDELKKLEEAEERWRSYPNHWG